MFAIRLGIPEMKALWDDLCPKADSSMLSKDEEKSRKLPNRFQVLRVFGRKGPGEGNLSTQSKGSLPR